MEDRSKKREGGSSLLEVLIAMAVLLFLMIGVLSMFSMAYLQNLGSAARTDMTYKAQQVADVVRYLNYLQRSQPTTGIPSTIKPYVGLTFPLSGGTSVTITDVTGSTLTYGYWGPPSSTIPDATGILNPADLPYSITIIIGAPNAVGLVTVTVAVVPNTATQNGSGPRYLGMAISHKEVDYVTQLPP